MKLKLILPWFGITAICGIGLGAAQAADLNEERQVAVSQVLIFFATAPCAVALLFGLTRPERYGIDLMALALGIYAATLVLSGLIGYVSVRFFLGQWG